MAVQDISLLRYSTRNLGDDIQTYAVSQFITADRMIDRDRLCETRSEAAIVLYGWLLQSRQWPPPSTVTGFPLSIHAAPRSRPLLLEHIDWWRSHGTISCRDASTAQFFLENDVPAVFEGCATLSLQRWLDPRPGTVVLVDIDSPTGTIPKVAFPTVVRTTHKIPTDKLQDQTFRAQATRDALETYQQAELVVTSRLHVLLPCLAFGTPVLFVMNDQRRSPTHFTRLIDYLPYVTVWDSQACYESGGTMPQNFRPTALIHHITKRLESTRVHLAD